MELIKMSVLQYVLLQDDVIIGSFLTNENGLYFFHPSSGRYREEYLDDMVESIKKINTNYNNSINEYLNNNPYNEKLDYNF